MPPRRPAAGPPRVARRPGASLRSPRLTLLAIAFWLGIAAVPAPAAAADEPAGDSAVRPVVAAIHFEGAEAVPESELLSHMVTRRPDRWRFWRARPRFSPGALEEDVRRIERVYRNHGYYEARAWTTLEWSADERQVEVTVHVDEGRPVRIADFRIELPEDSPLSADAGALEADLPLRPGQVFTLASYREARALLLERLADRARPAARLAGGADVDVSIHEARVHWLVEVGPEVTFGPVTVTGLDRIQEHVVRRELRVYEGEPYSARALDRSRRRLLALQLFRYVAVLPERPDPDADPPPDAARQVWPVTVELRERPPRSVALGVGWSSDDGPRGSARFAHRNFLGDARRLEIGGTVSEIDQQASIRVLQPYILGTLATLESDAAWRRRSRSSYDANVVSLTVGPRRSFGEHWVGEVAYRFGWTGVSNVTDQTDEVLREQRSVGLLSGVGTRWRRSDLDRVIDPTRGTWLQLGLGTNAKGLGSDFDWMRYSGEVRGYVPLGPTVLAGRFVLEAIDPFGSTAPNEVPLSERLFLGGANLGRGFPYEKLGPLDANGDPVGGTSSVLATAEWRFPIWKRLGGSVFVDAGQVSLDPFELDADDIGVGAGLGLSLATPVGPIVGYAAYPVRALEVSQRFRFYITVGHSF